MKITQVEIFDIQWARARLRMSAIDEALWDIKGKALGVPMYDLLGGCCWNKLLVYANGWEG